MSAGRPPEFSTVHAPLKWWAQIRPQRLALHDGAGRLDFASLSQQVEAQAAALQQSGAPAICWTQDSASPLLQLRSFLSILAADRTAAVSDPDWPPAVHDQVLARVADSASSADQMHGPAPSKADSPFYIGFTSGSSGLPKGFRRSHASWTSSFDVCLQSFGDAARETILVPGRLSHSLFLFGAMLGLWTGAGVRLQARFSAAAALETLARGEAGAMVAVPSQLILMLDLVQRRAMPAIANVRLLLIGGAPWNRARTPELQALFPQARIIEFYGASETSFIAWTDSDSTLPDHVVGRPFANVELRIDASAPDQPGLIYVRSPMVFSDYVTVAPDDEPAALLRDGDWLSVRDVGRLDEHGRLHLFGRQQRMLLTQGKNLFPEEVENIIAAHPAVEAASVQGIPDAVRGVQIAVLLRLSADTSVEQLQTWCRARLEPYKIPRSFYVCSDWLRTASGKSDHTRLGRLLRDAPESLQLLNSR
ncbi:AMP-binding protein [Herbaspirillum lusitanum]|uniref:AMP-binding protein n=1 Tax=Herbaspirillum lusitanum TaxID=213312 RepID=A0ABW9AB52_9BURK